MMQYRELFEEGQKVVLRDTENPMTREVFFGVSHERIFVVKKIDPVPSSLIRGVGHSQWLHVFDFLLDNYIGIYSGWYFTATRDSEPRI